MGRLFDEQEGATMAEPVEPEGFVIHDVWAPEEPNGNWGPADSVWAEWIKAHCRSRADVIAALRRALPVESSAVMQVYFTDTDGRRYGIEIHLGAYYHITRYEWDDAPGAQCFDQRESTSFGPHDAGLRSWHGEGHA